MNCTFCGIELTGKYQKKYCSVDCQKKEMYRIASVAKKRTCKACGEEFTMPPMSARARRGEDKAGLFCSRICRWDHWRAVRNRAKKDVGVCGVYLKTCKICGYLFVSRKPRMLCGRECELEYGRRDIYRKNSEKKDLRERPCMECGAIFTPEYGDKRRVFCSRKCSKRYAGHNREGRKDRERAHYYGVAYEYINPNKVFERDGWHCQICGKDTPAKRRGTFYSNAPEIDHRKPISKGGSHLYCNVQCACRSCNGRKSNKGEAGQLPLFEIKRAA